MCTPLSVDVRIGLTLMDTERGQYSRPGLYTLDTADKHNWCFDEGG